MGWIPYPGSRRWATRLAATETLCLPNLKLGSSNLEELLEKVKVDLNRDMMTVNTNTSAGYDDAGA